MQTMKFIWMNGKLVNWEEAQVHVLTHGLHYGSSVFEGIRAYKTDKGAAIFRLKEHVDRLFYSGSVLKMEIPFSREEIFAACVETVKANEMQEGYVRPLAYYGYGVMGLNPRNAPVDLAVACWPWGKYLGEEMVDIKISQYIRIHPKSLVADAKVSGHYVNSILAALEVRGTEFHEALFLDFNGVVAEGPGENFFIVKDGVLHTPKLGTILAGITRNTVFEMAKRLGLEVRERDIKVEEFEAIDEAFFTGTAAEITPIRSIEKKVIGSGVVGPITDKIRTTYQDIVHGRVDWAEGYLTRVQN